MPKIRNFVLPPPLVEELVRVAQRFPPDLVLEWGRIALPGGFTKPEIIRERMIARFRSDAPLDALTLDMLNCELSYRDTIAALALPALQELVPSFAAVAQPGTIILALLVDPREEVHRLGIEMLSRPFPGDTIAPEVVEIAEDRILSFVEERFLWEFDLKLPGDAPPLPPSPELENVTLTALSECSRQVKEQQERLDHLNAELQNQKQRYLARSKEQSEAAEHARQALRNELQMAQQQAQKALREKQAVESRLAEAAREREALIARAVREQTSALVRKWLQPPLQVEAALQNTAAGTDELLARVSRVLDAQTRQDRHTGNRRELENRVNALAQAREQLVGALQNALFPVAELKPVLAEVETELEKLRSALSAGRAPRSDLASRLLNSIGTAATWDEVQHLSHLLGQLADNDLLPAGEARELLAAIHRKFSLLGETEKQKGGEVDTGWSLRDALYRNKPALLVLDGHNLLFNLPDIFASSFEGDRPGRKARERLIELVGKLVGPRPNIQAKICFDGPKSASENLAPNLEVVYSGGTGTDRADDVIVSQLQFKDLKSLDQKVFVVTDDRQIRKHILQTGAKFVRNDLFALFLADFGVLS